MPFIGSTSGSAGWGLGISASPPKTTSFTGTISQTTNQTITVNGSQFVPGSEVIIDGPPVSNVPRALVTTYVSPTQITAVTQGNVVSYSTGTFTITVKNPNGLSSTPALTGTVNDPPTWVTASGSLGTFNAGQSISVTVTANANGSGDSVTYSISAGALPSGVSLNASTGAITGTSSPSSSTTSSFTVRATDTVSQIADRAFSITVNAIFLSASGGSTGTTGNFRYHIFNSGGTFTVNQVNAGEPTYGNKVRYLIIAGGGGGGGFGSQGPSFPGDGNFGSAGGGGAGGFLTSGAEPSGYNVTVNVTTYPVAVGGGGSGGVGSAPGNNGGTSSVFGVTASGGGGGGRQDQQGLPGGSGGGNGTDGAGHNSGVGGSGIGGQGSPGGRGASSQNGMSGGGGGAGGAGGEGFAAPGLGGVAGIGADSDITGSTVRYAGGGGGARYPGGPHPNTAPPGGGGGGTGGLNPNSPGANGTPGLGGGGGGSCDQDPRDFPEPFGGTGGSGVVIVRYKYQ